MGIYSNEYGAHNIVTYFKSLNSNPGFSDGRLAIEAFGPSESSRSAPVRVVVADDQVPLSKWVHLAVQRSGPDLEFFMDGNPGGKVRDLNHPKSFLASLLKLTSLLK